MYFLLSSPQLLYVSSCTFFCMYVFYNKIKVVSQVYNPLHIFFIMTALWIKVPVEGLYNKLFYVIIPTLFLYFCHSAIPTSCYVIYFLLSSESHPLPVGHTQHNMLVCSWKKVACVKLLVEECRNE